MFGARLTLLTPSHRLDVNFCFACGIAAFVIDGAEPRLVDFKTGEFARLFRERFPDDPIASKFR